MLKTACVTAFIAGAIASLIGAHAGCTDAPEPPPPPARGGETTQPSSISCDHRGFSCFPWRGGDATCEYQCGNGYYCASYSTDEIEFCYQHPGQNYRGNPEKPCLPGGDPWWNTYCVPGRIEGPAGSPSK
jgi:hypothetical protein